MQDNEKNDFMKEFNNAAGDALEQIKSGEIKPDDSLYDFIKLGIPPTDISARHTYEEIKKAIDICAISDDELKTLINSIAFQKEIPLAVKLYVVLNALIEFNTTRSNHE